MAERQYKADSSFLLPLRPMSYIRCNAAGSLTAVRGVRRFLNGVLLSIFAPSIA